ncbi:MAG: hemolysin family protein [Methanospirillum sp.]|nr:hemolysin family protein [Methanospirillum sp.]
MSLFIDLIIITLLIFANGFFSLAEFGLVSARKVKLRQMASDGIPGADAAIRLAEDQTGLLSTIQIGITLIGICTGAYGGAAFAQELAPYFSGIPIIGAYSDLVSLVIIVLVITYFSIVIGELVPKRIGLSRPEHTACTVAPLMVLITRISTPVSYLTSGLTNFIMSVLGQNREDSPEVIEEEIHMLLEEGTEAGIIDKAEQKILESVFELSESSIVDLMVPRPDIVALNIEDPIEDNRKIMQETGHTRYPVYRGNLDTVIGVLSVRDLWAHISAGHPEEISAVMQEIVVVPKQITALELLRRFRTATSPLGVIIDEYGSVVGMITLHDLLEALVGDLSRVDHEEEKPRIVRRTDDSWLVDGKTPIDELHEDTGIDCSDQENKGQYRTLAGFILNESGEIPREGDIIPWNGLQFRVVSMDGHRIDKILLTKKKE